MRKGTFALALCASVLLSGCVSGNIAYQKPTSRLIVDNTVVLEQSADKAWAKIIPRLSQSFFVVNNIDKESGFINLSYSGDPVKYIECGYIDSTVDNARGKRTYSFPAASGYKKYEMLDRGTLFTIDRRMELEGRVNLVVQDLGADESSVSVNTRYTVNKHGTWLSASGHSGAFPNETIGFNTNGGATFGDGTECRTIGNLEKEILSIVRG